MVAQARPEGFARTDTTLTLALSALLIVNSHLESFYPSGLQFLAADGLLGNSLFYMLSGFGIQSSLMSREQSFASYMRRRVLRIYPETILVVMLFLGLIGGGFATWTLQQYFAEFVWPTSFTYVQWIVIFYAFGYLLNMGHSSRVLTVVIGALWLAYFALYARDFPSLAEHSKLSLGNSDTRMAALNYASLFCLGMLLARLGTRVNLGGFGGWYCWAPLLGVLLLYFGIKFMMVVMAWRPNAYPLLHILVFIASPLLVLGLSGERLMSALQNYRLLWIGIAFVGGLTLEYYLLHAALIATLPLAAIIFPLNILALLALTSLLAPLLRSVATGLVSFTSRKAGAE